MAIMQIRKFPSEKVCIALEKAWEGYPADYFIEKARDFFPHDYVSSSPHAEVETLFYIMNKLNEDISSFDIKHLGYLLIPQILLDISTGEEYNALVEEKFNGIIRAKYLPFDFNDCIKDAQSEMKKT